MKPRLNTLETRRLVPPTVLCTMCRRQVSEVVQVGEEPDWDSATCNLCRDCLQAAIDVLDAR